MGTEFGMRVAIIPAGAGGMFCGSCLHDNAWARGLQALQIDATLLPLYTPIRVDEANHSGQRVFYGGINVYLDSYVPGWKHLPRWLTRPLNASWLLNLAAKRGVSNDAAELGSLAVSMLQGAAGPQAREGAELIDFLIRELHPDVIIFSNLMLAADAARLKAAFRGPILCTLQGDDIFLNGLHEPWRSQALELLCTIAQSIDGFITHSHFYAESMGTLLGIPASKFHQLPLAIDCQGHDGQPRPRESLGTIGYFARVAPEKGLKEFIAAGLKLNEQRQDFRLVAGGYLPPQFQTYLEECQQLAAPLQDRFVYAGSPDLLPEKVALIRSFDILSVPAPYRDPKGLYVLEAWANGVPVVQPDHGHFPEVLDDVGGGWCVPAGNALSLAAAWNELLSDEARRLELGHKGWHGVRAKHDISVLATKTRTLLTQFLS